MTLWQELLLVTAGLAAGYINVMAGGGSLLTVPIMLFMDLPGPVANGTNRIAILAQCLVSIRVFFKKGMSELKLSLTLGLCTLPGALLGAMLGIRLEGIWFNRLIALIMVIVMLSMIFGRNKPSQDKKEKCKPQRLVLTHVLMLVVGFYGGLIQVGVGFLIMPILHKILGLDLVRVNMHKIFLVLPFTVLSLFIYATQSGVYWTAGLCLALGNSLGGWAATHMMIKEGGEKLIKVIFNTVLLIFIIKLIFFY